MEINENIHIIDAHTHVQFPEYDKDRDEVIKRASKAGVGMINVGTDMDMSRRAIELARKYGHGTWASVGIHPHASDVYLREPETTMRELEELAMDESVVGIGECGLDYFKRKGAIEPKEIADQKKLFEAQVDLSHRVKKPLIAHVRPSATTSDAFIDVLDIITAHKNLLGQNPGICHFFTGNKDVAKKFIELNFSFTFGGLVTYNREFDEALDYIPADHILLETDAPFVPPKSHRSHRNEPVFITETAQFLSDFKKVPREVFLQNTRRVFGV